MLIVPAFFIVDAIGLFLSVLEGSSDADRRRREKQLRIASLKELASSSGSIQIATSHTNKGQLLLPPSSKSKIL